MPELSIGGLYQRIRPAAAAYLGERSPSTLHAYVSGYDDGLAHYGAAPLLEELPYAQFRRWVSDRVHFTDEHQCRLNARSVVGPDSYALLRSADEAEALEVYFDLWSEALGEYRAAGGVPARKQRFEEPASLIGQIQLIRQRPGMWFGSEHVRGFWAFASGYRWAERDLGQSSVDAARLDAFQAWMDERYPFGRGGTWARTIRFLAMAVPGREYRMFGEHLDLFLEGADSDALDPTMVKMMAAIVAKARGSSGGADDGG